MTQSSAPVSGCLEGIYVCASAGSPMRALESVRAVAGRGIQGDRYWLGTGHWTGRGSDPVTLVEAEVVDELGEGGSALAPGALRRNLVVRGIRLEELIGRRFLVGTAVLEGLRACEPCRYLETLLERPGLVDALLGRGGLRAVVVRSGTMSLGDAVEAMPGARAAAGRRGGPA